jgi:hypothetical protein
MFATTGMGSMVPCSDTNCESSAIWFAAAENSDRGMETSESSVILGVLFPFPSDDEFQLDY